MNVNDSEVAWSILKDSGYTKTSDVKQVSQATEQDPQVLEQYDVQHYHCCVFLLQADVILAVTCSIRENAERKVWSRLDFFRSLKRKRSRDLPPLKVGVLG